MRQVAKDTCSIWMMTLTFFRMITSTPNLYREVRGESLMQMPCLRWQSAVSNNCKLPHKGAVIASGFSVSKVVLFKRLDGLDMDGQPDKWWKKSEHSWKEAHIGSGRVHKIMHFGTARKKGADQTEDTTRGRC